MIINNKDIKKFSVDKEYFFVFYSNEFVLENVDDLGDAYYLTVRWEYNNNTKFSNYDKPFTGWGKRANFTLALCCKTEVQGKESWLPLIGDDIDHNYETKKQMMEHIDQMMDEFSGKKEKFYNFDNYKIKKTGE